MKKTLSIVLSIVMLFSIMATVNISAFADGWVNSATSIQFDTVYTDKAEETDPKWAWNDKGISQSYRYDSFYFTVPEKGNVAINIQSKDVDYFTQTFNSYTDFYIYDKNDTTNYYIKSEMPASYDGGLGIYKGNINVTLPKGNYYFVMEYTHGGGWGLYQTEPFDICFKYKPIIPTPTNFKVASRGATSLKLAWSKASGVSGYQLQRLCGSSYKTITNTTSTTATVSNLSTATNYKFRVRAYKSVSGKYYYGSWRYLTTPTRPGKVGINTPSTNSKHQIVAKWNKVTRASGYQVQYCKNSSCSSVIATKLVSGQSKTSYTGSGFTKGRNYYVRVRAYRTVDGTRYYGAWSSVKSIKCK